MLLINTNNRAPFVQLQVYVNSQEASGSSDRVYSTVSSPRNELRNRLSL